MSLPLALASGRRAYLCGRLANIVTPIAIGILVQQMGSFGLALIYVGVIALVGTSSYPVIVGTLSGSNSANGLVQRDNECSLDPAGEIHMTPPERMRALLSQPAFVVMPAVWDGLSAKLVYGAGFKTAFLSGSCVAASRLGGPDLDLVSFAEMLNSLDMVRGAASDLLVLADADHGYGNAMNVQRTVRAYGRAGAAAILVEDKITPRALTAAGKPCIPREEMRMKIRAAVEAAKDSGILVMARTDCRPTDGIDEAVARIEMYVEEGADILFLEFAKDETEIRRAVSAASGRPSFAVLSPGGLRATPTQTRAAELGLKIGAYPTGMLSPAIAGMMAGLRALAAGQAEATMALPSPELRNTLGYDDYDRQAKNFVLPGQ
jgi:2-methylisocitrate lyase-like PEP mutase family enzyme